MIELRGVGKAYGARQVVEDLSLHVKAGERVVLLGASGSGKSTLLKLINRLIEPDRGEIFFAGQPVAQLDVQALRHRIGYVIQSTGLFPHWSVARNVATVPTLLKWPRERIDKRVDELLRLLGLEPAQFASRYPHQLSGGQQQRVGVARALAAGPEVLLMDEPFGALDPVIRSGLQDELLRLHAATGTTIVFVTHDVDEALRLATRIVLLDQGRIAQSGTPAELLARPANAHVADFLGGGEAGLRLLGLKRVDSLLRPGEAASTQPAVSISGDATLRDALALCLGHRVDQLAVIDADGKPLGTLHAADLLRAPR